ncbi:hypothetical protein [Dickeya undicola]|uniref:hypothetical protein n=1 Tax=Dickeya undicola TaxID=1577887 RepID=UPI001F47129E|nr:hypothetical protein [Dickeya undicola]
MRIHRFTGRNATLARLLALLLPLALLIPLAVDAAPPAPVLAPSAAPDTPTYAQCLQALERMGSRRFTRITQDKLAIIYHDNPAYQADYHQPGDYLADGLFGPKTRKWLATFCGDFGITPPPNDNTFAENLLVSLTKVSELDQVFPFWRSRMSAPELLQWPTQKTIDFLSAQADIGASAVSDLATPPYDAATYYQLTDDDLDKLAKRNAIQTQLDGLTGHQFTSPVELNNAVRPLIRQLQGNEQQILRQIVDAEPVSDGNANRPQTTTQPSPDEDDSADSQQNSEVSTAAPITVYSLNQNALELAYLDLNLVSVDKEALARLTSLKDAVFADRYQLAVAMKMAGLGHLGQQNWQRIMKIARKQGVPPQPTPPMVWRAPADCGCEDSARNINGATATFYGFYPYWQPLANGQALNFRQLDRIGYFSATVLPDARGPHLVLPPNWRPDSIYSGFIRLAHRYRTNIDLVVSTPRKLPSPTLVSLFTSSLIARLVTNIQTPLTDDWVNRAKPWLTFGLSPLDTLADGVTLDFDLTQLTTRAGQQTFVRFVQVLRKTLTPAGPATDSPPRYAINLMVPVEPLLKGQGFYTLDNLRELLPYVDRFILQPDSADMPGTQRGEQEQLRDLRHMLSQQPQAAVPELYRKMVPVLITENNRQQPAELAELVRYSSWSFLSVAYWPLPLNETSQQLISQTYYPTADLPAPLAQIVSAANAVIDLICPNRWVLRLILFITFWGIVITWLTSLWCFPVRKVTNTLWFAGFVVLFAAALMLALVADPYWQQYQTVILLLFAALVVAIAMLQRIRKNRQGRNP